MAGQERHVPEGIEHSSFQASGTRRSGRPDRRTPDPDHPTVIDTGRVKCGREPAMTEHHEYTQFQCDVCGFRTRSPDQEEVIEIALQHSEGQHDATLDRDEIEGELRTLELEGYPGES